MTGDATAETASPSAGAEAGVAGGTTVSEELLVRRGLPVLERVAARLYHQLGRCVACEDLAGIGRPALVEAVRAYDPNIAPFEPYLAKRLEWAIRDGVRRETHGRSAVVRARALGAAERLTEVVAGEGREPQGALTEAQYKGLLRARLDAHAAALAVGLAGASGAPGDGEARADSPEQKLIGAEARAKLLQAIAELSDPRGKALIQKHYFEGERFDAVAEELGVSKSWASRIHAAALRSLARKMAAFGPAHA